EPQDEQRHPGDRGNRAQALQGGVDETVGQRRIAGDCTKDCAGGHAEAESGQDAGGCHERVLLQLAGCGQVPKRVEDHRGRWQQAPGRKPHADRDLPADREQARQQETERGPRQTHEQALARLLPGRGLFGSRSHEEKRHKPLMDCKVLLNGERLAGSLRSLCANRRLSPEFACERRGLKGVQGSPPLPLQPFTVIHASSDLAVVRSPSPPFLTTKRSSMSSSTAFFTSTRGPITPAFCSATPASRIESRCAGPTLL